MLNAPNSEKMEPAGVTDIKKNVIAGLIVPCELIYTQPTTNFWEIMSQTVKGAAHCNFEIDSLMLMLKNKV